MATPKIIWEPKKENNLQDKKNIESLIQRLNTKITSNPQLAKKAALILEKWLNEKPKKK